MKHNRTHANGTNQSQPAHFFHIATAGVTMTTANPSASHVHTATTHASVAT